jgi:hypothetical protein
MIIRCDGISGISTRSMTELPASLSRWRLVCRRESRIRSTTALAALIAPPAELVKRSSGDERTRLEYGCLNSSRRLATATNGYSRLAAT